RVSGGFIYDRLLGEHLRAAGAVVDEVRVPWWPLGPALAAGLLPLPRALGLSGHDVVLQDELCHPTVWLRNRRLRRAGIPVVALVHNLACAQPSGRRTRLAGDIERRYLSELDGVVAVCESTRRDVEACLAAPVPIVVAPAGRDHVPNTGLDEALVAERARGD